MKRVVFNYLVIAAFVVSAVFTSCNKDKPEHTGQLEVNLRADINKPATKVANDQWETADKVGLYMKPSGQPLSTAYSNARNAQMSLEGQTLVASTTILYPDTCNVDFIAYYPYTASVASDYTIDVNV